MALDDLQNGMGVQVHLARGKLSTRGENELSTMSRKQNLVLLAIAALVLGLLTSQSLASFNTFPRMRSPAVSPPVTKPIRRKPLGVDPMERWDARRAAS